MKKLLASLLLSFIASYCSADNSVQLVTEIDADHCRLINKNVCVTEKRDEKKAIKKCNKWHINQASEQGANRVLITDNTYSEHRRPHYDGSSKTIKTREYLADYYACDLAEVSVVNDTQQEALPVNNSGASKSSIEDRLLRLESLKKKGLISAEEYAAKRAEILSEL
ncbi:hypothetical protein P886_0726 [Alteromonadaceae bacterium 2753L.S.0a.02]|nr:hypothetical protein P886_0726 [Alteromonadaceae bacterium 2753L.S.0a.02]